MSHEPKKHSTLTVRLPFDLHQRARQTAADQFCSVAAVIRQALQAHLGHGDQTSNRMASEPGQQAGNSQNQGPKTGA